MEEGHFLCFTQTASFLRFSFLFGTPAGATTWSILRNKFVFHVFFVFGPPAGATRSARRSRPIFVAVVIVRRVGGIWTKWW
jgi:hypothetical protein